MISLGRLDVRLIRNDLYCWGLGIEFHTVDTHIEDPDSIDCFIITDARVFRIDLLFFSINFTMWSKQDWNEN